MNLKIRRYRKTEIGASAVEFAIVLPVLLLVLFGIIEFSLFFYNKHVITNAAREGARRGVIVRGTPRDKTAEDADIRARVIEYAQQFLVNFGSDVLTNADISLDPNRSLAFGEDLVVEVDYSYDFLFLSTIGVGPITIHGRSSMRME